METKVPMATGELYVAIDIGGTFTDLYYYDVTTGQQGYSKVLTTPEDPTEALIAAVDEAEIQAERVLVLKHGTTLVINMLVEERGARTALVTTQGFRDILEVGRGNRTRPYDLFYSAPAPLVPRPRRFEVPERINSRGEVLTRLDQDAVAALIPRLRAEGVESVAVCLLHAYANPEHEQAVAAQLRAGFTGFVTASTEISREFREYERTYTAVCNAYVGPAVARYLDSLVGRLCALHYRGRIFLMQSSGGVISLDQARQRPIILVESGPAGGVLGATRLGLGTGAKDLIAFDMGGTTAKAAIIEDGTPSVTTTYHIGGYGGRPLQVPTIDIVEVGAGGGSIAWLDETGALRVGPRSAGAAPGPACYGRGGSEPTVTDANVVLGRLDNLLGGKMALARNLAADSLARLGRRLGLDPVGMASGVVEIANLLMAAAVRRVSIERGRDPRDFTLVAFGGAGPLHATAIARELGIPRVVIPPQPGHFSAVGMLHADLQHDVKQTCVRRLEQLSLAEVSMAYRALEEEATDQIRTAAPADVEITCKRFADLRFVGQEHAVSIPVSTSMFVDGPQAVTATFSAEYLRRYGDCDRVRRLARYRHGFRGPPAAGPRSHHNESHRRTERYEESLV